MVPSGIGRGRQDADDLRLEPRNGRGWVPSVQSRSDNAGSGTILVTFAGSARQFYLGDFEAGQ